MRTLAIIALSLILAGCATTQPPATAGATFCQVGQPIYWSAQDTSNTKKQVDSHNRVGRKLCRW